MKKEKGEGRPFWRICITTKEEGTDLSVSWGGVILSRARMEGRKRK